MKRHDPKQVQLPAPAIKDTSKVRIGGYSLALPVRSAPTAVADTRKVRIGGYSPAL
jgi:hypothetical protein